MAEKFQRKTEGQLAAGTYQSQASKAWSDFRESTKSADSLALHRYHGNRPVMLWTTSRGS